MLNSLYAFNRIISRICIWSSGFGLVLMTIIVGWQVFARYVLNSTPHWSEKFCLLLMIYFILFAAAAGVREGTHIGLVFVKESLPAFSQRIVGVIDHLIVGSFGFGMVWFGMDMVSSTWSHTIPTLGIPTGISYLPFPLAGLLFMLFSLEHIFKTILNKTEL